MRSCAGPAAFVAVAAAVVAAGGTAGARDSAVPAQGDEVLRPALVSGWAGSAASRRLRVEVTHGICSKGERLTGLRLTRRTVRVRFAEVFAREQADLACPAVARVSCFTVTLPRARGRRSVVDAGSGRRVPRAAPPSPAASGRRCPAAPRG